MLRRFGCTNYKPFKSPVTIDVCPLTLFIGRNNSGKSALLRLPRLLLRSLSSRAPRAGMPFAGPQGAIGPQGSIGSSSLTTPGGFPLEVDGVSFGRTLRDLIHGGAPHGSVAFDFKASHDRLGVLDLSATVDASETTVVSLVGKQERPVSLSPEKAVQLLQKPLVVLMENRNTDGAFLDAVLAVLGDPELLRLKQLRDQALKYDSVGGSGELKKLVKHEHEKSEAADVPFRAVVFTDNDSRFPGDISKMANEIRETCERLGIPHVVLTKRAIENYIPDEVIAEWADTREHTSARPRIAALLRLTPEQREHFPFKKGLSFLGLSADSNHPIEEHRLYANVSAPDRALLDWRFGEDFVMVLWRAAPFDSDGVSPRTAPNMSSRHAPP